MYTMSKLRKQALIRIVICVIMLAATIVFSFLLITGKLDGTSSSVPSACSRRARVSFCVFFRLAACALPRPSATDSAKLANSTVMNSTTETMML